MYAHTHTHTHRTTTLYDTEYDEHKNVYILFFVLDMLLLETKEKSQVLFFSKNYNYNLASLHCISTYYIPSLNLLLLFSEIVLISSRVKYFTGDDITISYFTSDNMTFAVTS